MTTRKLWKSESGEVYSAESAEEAKKLRDNWNGWDPEGTDSREDPFDDEPIDDNFELEVTTDGPVVETFGWAHDEPEARCEAIGVMHRISAKASVFAKHEHGPVFGEDW